jgi:hypothetical protein
MAISSRLSRVTIGGGNIGWTVAMTHLLHVGSKQEDGKLFSKRTLQRIL